MDTGICVKVVQKLDLNGNRVCIATHKRDGTTAYRLQMQTKDPAEALEAWMKKFTGVSGTSKGLAASFNIVARGSDHEAYYYILVPYDFG